MALRLKKDAVTKRLSYTYNAWQDLATYISSTLYDLELLRPEVEYITSKLASKVMGGIIKTEKTHNLSRCIMKLDVSDWVEYYLHQRGIYLVDNVVYKQINTYSAPRFEYPSNRYTVLNEDETPIGVEEDDEPRPSTSGRLSFEPPNLFPEVINLKIKNKKKYNYSNLNYDVELPFKEVPSSLNCNMDLRGRLRDIISSLRSLRTKGSLFCAYIKSKFVRPPPIHELVVEYYRHIDPCYEVLEDIPEYNFEMDEGSHGEVGLSTSEKSNVILTESRIESEEQTAPVENVSWTNLCTSDVIVDYNKLVDRWIQIDTFDWSKSVTQGSLLKTYELPLDLVLKEPTTPCRMANTVPFTIHRYWKGDLEVKIQVNSNKFQIGQLQVSWLYVPDFDSQISSRLNIHNLSQANHVLVNASSSNEASLTIPFKYYLPYLHTKPRGDMPRPLVLGKMFIYVLNPLVVSTGGSDSAAVTVFIRAFNNEFTGMISGALDSIENLRLYEPEMDAMTDVIGGLVSTFIDRNRDNPPNVRPPPMLVPTASHSWAVGTGLGEPLHPMRLDGRGQVPHPPGIDVNDEMLLRSITSKFGLLRTIEWTKEMAVRTVIFDCDAAPLMNRDDYYRDGNTDNNSLFTYRVPPVGVVSSMFMSWRGTLEFKFDVIATQFHTGRLLLAYIPGARRDQTITFDHLRASSNMVFNLQESQQFSYIIPYIANKPMWPRAYAGDYDLQDAIAPSRLYMAVLNKLIPMQSVTDKIYINVYVRGGPDFELLVPVQPALGLGYNNHYLFNTNTTGNIVALPGYSPYYSGQFEDFSYAEVFRWGTLSHQIAQFTEANIYDAAQKQYSYSALVVPQPDFVARVANSSSGDSKLIPIEFAVFLFLPQLGYVCGVPCLNENAAKKLAYNILVLNKSLNDDVNKPYIISNEFSTSDNTYCKDNPVWKIIWEKIPVSEAEMPERDSSSNVIMLGGLTSTNFGMKLYGEYFGDLKDLTRRYQLYATIIIPAFSKTDMEKIRVSFPILPQGLELDMGTKNNINQIFNRGREGHIPLIASGYRYYRGGVRLRFIVNPRFDALIFVQHRPDRILNSTKVVQDVKVITGESVANHTYASYIQLSSVNGVVEIEVPFYLLGMYGLLQRPKLTFTEESNYFSLGEMCVGVSIDPNQADKLKNCLLTVYYSMADDMSFSTFQGFPKMVFLSDIPSETPKLKEIVYDDSISNLSCISEYEPEGLLDMFFDKDKMEQEITEVADNVVDNTIDKVRTAVALETSHFTDSLKEAIKSFDASYKDNMLKIGLEIIHIIACPEIKTLALSTIKILLELKIIIITSMQQFITAVTDLLIRWTSKVSSEPTTETANVTQFEPEGLFDTFEAKDWVAFAGLIFSGICAFTGLTCPRPRNMSLFCSFFTSSLPNAAKSGNFIVSFLTSTIELVKRLFRWIIMQVYPVEGMFYDIQDQMPEIKDWVQEVLYLTSKDLDSKLDMDGYFYDRVFAAHIFGQQLTIRYCEEKNSKISTLIRFADKINQYYDRMLALGKHPFLRKEPYCIWIEGVPGIGKSYLMEFLTSEMLKAIKYKLRGPKVFTIMPAGEFWTGCKNQPVLNVDDAFSVEMGQTLERQLNTMYMVKSPVALNPPMADLADKHLRYNPEIFYINSNKAFLNIAGVDPTAIHRRRDALVRVQYSDPTRTSTSQYSLEELSEFKHMSFYIARDVKDIQTAYDGPFNYMQFKKKICDHFRKFYRQELVNFEQRLETYEAILEDEETEEDAKHIHTLHEKVMTKHDKARLEYLSALDKCWYSKLQRWKVEISNKYFNVSIKDRLLGPLYNLRKEKEPETPEVIAEGALDQINCADIINHLNDYYKKFELKYVGKRPGFRLNYIPRENEMMNVIYERVFVNQIVQMLSYIVTEDYQNLSYDLQARGLYIVSGLCAIIYNYYESKIKICLDTANMTSEWVREFCTTTGMKQDFQLSEWDIKTYFSVNSLIKIDSRILDYILESRLNSYEENFNISRYQQDLVSFDLVFKVINQVVKLDIIYPASATYNHRRLYALYESLCEWKSSGSTIYQCCHLDMEAKFDPAHKVFRLSDRSIKDNMKCGSSCIFNSKFMQVTWHMHVVYSDRKLRKQFNDRDYKKLPYFFAHSPFVDKLETLDYKFLDSLTVDICDWIKRTIPSKVLKWLGVIGKIASFIVMIFMMVKGVSWAFPNLVKSIPFVGYNPFTPAVPQPETVAKLTELTKESFAIAENSYKVPTKVFTNPLPFRLSNPQININTTNNIRSIIRNSFFIVAEYINENGTPVETKGRCLGIEGNRAICIRHYHDVFLSYPDSTRYYYETVTQFGVNRIELDYRNLRTDCIIMNEPGFGTNFFILYLPPQVPKFKTITNLIPPISQHSHTGRTGKLLEYGGMYRDGVQFRVHGSFRIKGRGAMEEVTVIGGYAYDIHGYGMCGSLLLADSLPNTPLIAMHVAGGDSNGLAEPLYREMFMHLKPQVIRDFEDPSDLSDLEPKHVLSTNVFSIGAVVPEMYHPDFGKTSLAPSEIAGVFPIRTEPNPLSMYDKRLPKGEDPLIRGCEKHGLPVRPFKVQNLDIAAEHVSSWFKTSIVPIRSTVSAWSLQDSVCGNVNIKHCEPLNWTSSPGYGYTHLADKQSGKKWLFKLDEKEDGFILKGIHPRLKEIMKRKQNLREQGVVPYTVFTDCLKDTCLPKEKCRIPGKTRIFSISPVDFTIQFKMYFGDFLASYTAARLNAGHAIGINCDGPEWTDLALKLQSKGDNVVDIDFSNYGPGLPLDVAYAAFAIIIEWYRYHGASKGYIKILWCFAHEILNAYHLCRDHIYQVCSGIPSGSPITAPLNSIVHNILIRLVWMDIMEKQPLYSSLESFEANVCDVVYGDDGIYNVSDNVKELFNAETIISTFSKYNIVCTNARKCEEVIKYYPLTDASFLSREFLFHPTRPGIYLPGLKKISIEGTSNWVRPKDCGLRAASLVNSRMTVELAFGWGPKYYSEVYEKLRAKWATLNERFVAKTWTERDREIFDLGVDYIYFPLEYYV